MPAVQRGHRAGRGVVIAICGLLVLSTVLVFVQTAGHDFVNCDDNEYVYENAAIQPGLTLKCAWWAITEAHSANWHPLTWMSHAPGLAALRQMGPGTRSLRQELAGRTSSGQPGAARDLRRAAIPHVTSDDRHNVAQPAVAALFAVHPLHVESVAWATGRKDTLSALFFILTLAAYRTPCARSHGGDMPW